MEGFGYENIASFLDKPRGFGFGFGFAHFSHTFVVVAVENMVEATLVILQFSFYILNNLPYKSKKCIYFYPLNICHFFFVLLIQYQ